MVVGKIGSGKTSLINALLGQLLHSPGDTPLSKQASFLSTRASSRVALVERNVWLQHLCIKQNILFGHPLEKVAYDRTIEACQLGPDLN